ncbi:acetyl-CoA carboxylase biotin carboxyl carrier protein [Tabrizicola oligotrophica]|uniref:Biotin carboxyl carrier protein of acetyl-CoA carboxylase n=1 Tax=Tabrizicola oligotrophica TaxID=2710650 RepID=A0A6M0QRT7_9RHOB|nr:biotin/lipoyl-containing protein [Tabrizicola oligotrophica]NEY90126.1 acetyl-CoA carboxylase, biotin carboxyl carrier protein [Tabrizicola oligotrophica]
MLTRAEIDDILRLIDGSDFTELKLEMGDLKLELRKGGLAQPFHTGQNIPAGGIQPQPPAPPAAVPAPVVASGGGSEIPAPLLGTFWHAPRPGAEPFVRPGDSVGADTVIGIIEVMKLMNSVAAGIAGTVLEITAPNGELVEHGQCLIRIRPH